MHLNLCAISYQNFLTPAFIISIVNSRCLRESLQTICPTSTCNVNRLTEFSNQSRRDFIVSGLCRNSPHEISYRVILPTLILN